MKRIIVLLALLVAITGKTVWAAGEENVPAPALETFKKEFPAAVFTKWERLEKTDIYIAWFVEEERGMLAYIDEEGKLLATIRIVTMDQLPLSVSRVIANNYSGYRVDKIEELVKEGSVSYLFAMQDKKTKMVLRVHSNGDCHKIRQERITE